MKMAAAPEVTDELWELHYQSPDTSNINPHTLEIGKNVVEVDYQYDTQNFYTALVPTDKDNNILVTANNDVQSVTDGHQTITAVRRKNSVIFRNVKLVKIYGLLVGLYQTESEIADSASLIGSTLSKAANLKPPKVSFSVHAKDTTMLTGDAPLEIGQYVQFRHPQRVLHALMLISKITMKLEDPTQNEIADTQTGIRCVSDAERRETEQWQTIRFRQRSPVMRPSFRKLCSRRKRLCRS